MLGHQGNFDYGLMIMGPGLLILNILRHCSNVMEQGSTLKLKKIALPYGGLDKGCKHTFVQHLTTYGCFCIYSFIVSINSSEDLHFLFLLLGTKLHFLFCFDILLLCF